METKKELSLGELLKVQNNLENRTRDTPVLQQMGSSKNNSKKRTNKNRPREQSSKIPVKMFHLEKSKKVQVRDPRFDNLCGTYNENFFRDTYSFLDEIKNKEKQQLEETLKEETDPTTRKQIKFLLKRIKDQEREKERKNKKEKKKIEQSEKLKQRLLEGKPARFKTKSEKKLSELVEKYEELKSKGKMQNYLKKKVKKTRKNDELVPFK